MNETEMRDAKVITPKTEQELNEYINKLLNQEHDYGTCVYAMSMASVATFNYIASKLGATGFQASCADLDFLKRTREMRGGFIILKGEDLLYPQYNLQEKLNEFINEQKKWLRDEAKKLLNDSLNKTAHPDVIAHWKKLSK